MFPFDNGMYKIMYLLFSQFFFFFLYLYTHSYFLLFFSLVFKPCQMIKDWLKLAKLSNKYIGFTHFK